MPNIELPRIRPAASPVDTFVRPADGGGLAQLATALGNFAPGLRQLGNEVSTRDAESQAAAGEAYATQLSESKDMWANAIRDGKIAPSQSPWFRNAARKKLGQVAADKFNVDLQQNIAQLGDSPTPDAFESAVGKARTDFLTNVAGQSAGDKAFMQGFDSLAEQHISSARRTFAADNAKQFEMQASDAYFNATHAIARKAIESGQSADQIATALNGESDAWTGVNPAAKRAGTISGSKMSKLNADVVFSLMRSTHNVKLATDLASKIKDGDGTLLDSAEFQTRLEAETDHVTADARQKDEDAYTHMQRDQRDAEDTARETLYSRWKSGGAVDTTDVEAQLKAVGVHDPHTTALALLDKMPEMDPKFYVDLRSRVANGKYPAQEELDRAARTNRISAGQYSSLINDISEAQNAERALQAASGMTTDAIWSHPAMRAMEDNIKAAAKTKAKLGPLGEIVSYTGFTESDVQQAVTQGKLFMAQWLSQNWTKFGSGRTALEQAGIAWRGFAADHGILTTDEAGFGKQVLPSDPQSAASVERNRASAAKKTQTPPAPGQATAQPTTNFTKAEIHQMRSDLAGFTRMSQDERVAWVTTPRHREILRQLGDPPISSLGKMLADAESNAR